MYSGWGIGSRKHTKSRPEEQQQYIAAYQSQIHRPPTLAGILGHKPEHQRTHESRMQTANFIVAPEESSARRGRWHAQPDSHIQLKLHLQLRQRLRLQAAYQILSWRCCGNFNAPLPPAEKLMPSQPASKIYVLCSWAFALTSDHKIKGIPE